MEFVQRGEGQGLGAGVGLSVILRSYLVYYCSVSLVTPLGKASFSLSRLQFVCRVSLLAPAISVVLHTHYQELTLQ